MISEERFSTLMGEIGLPEAAQEYARFALYCAELQEWNRKINLTAITDDEGIAVKHFADSLLPLTMTELPQAARLMDVGSGAGFPSLPMALVRGDLRVTFLDSLQKRLRFLEQLSEKLRVPSTTLHIRAEDAGRNPVHREKYDVVTARAVAAMSTLAEFCLPLVKTGGVFLALKGSSGREELAAGSNAITQLGGKVEAVHDYTLPGGDARVLLVIRKERPTLPRYPRETSQIIKKPL